MLGDLLERLRGWKKISGLIMGILTVFIGVVFELDEDSVNKIVGLIMTYIFGQSIADNGQYRNSPIKPKLKVNTRE